MTRLLIAVLLFACVPLTAMAESMAKVGPWDVHYMAFRSTFVKPEIARKYDLERSRYKAIVNISALASDDPQKAAQRVELSGYATNPIGSRQQLEFSEVIEGDAIYYLAQINYTNLEIIRFTLTIKAEGEPARELKFQQQFYADD